MLKILLIPLLSALLFLTGCTQGKQSQAKFVVTMSALVGDITFTGGATVRLVNSQSGVVLEKDLVSPYEMFIPHGSWNIYLVGFDGASAWGSPQRCGSLLNVNLYDPTATVEILVSAANCTPEPFVSMISAKTNSTSTAGKWDLGQWDQATWGP